MAASADPLLRELEEVIAGEGPITYARYLELALYHPHHGYYAERVPGRGVDYATSASIGSWFGRFVARELERMWEALGRPDPFTVVEFGAGLGGIAAGAIDAAGPLAPALRWRIVERFDRVAALQRRHLGDRAAAVEWVREPAGPPVTGCVLANEVLDNFPFHRFAKTDGELREVFVTFRDGRLAEELGPPSAPELLAPIDGVAARLNEGDRFEICPGIAGWCQDAARILDRGYLLTIDYGDEEPDIWMRGPAGTLATYGRATPGRPISRRRGYRVGRPLDRPGRKDVTADVDFTALAREAEGAGFDFELLTLQSVWLRSLGIAEAASELEAEARIALAAGWRRDAEALVSERDELVRLADPEGLGGCLVFRASKGFPGSR